MHDLPPGWATDVAVLALGGSRIDDRGDHLVVRTEHNPDFHWGNFLLVTEPGAVDQAERWVAEFHQAFPDANWIAVGLPRLPDDIGAWTRLGLEVETDDVLTAHAVPPPTALAPGYTARRLTGTDWEQSVRLWLAEDAGSAVVEPAAHKRFVRAQAKARRELSEHDVAAFFGAFAGDVLVAELGIVRCDSTARYQSVATEAEHRRRGLASHLLGLAAGWAADWGCGRWVIVTEATNSAGRLYRSLGFSADLGKAQAYCRQR